MEPSLDNLPFSPEFSNEAAMAEGDDGRVAGWIYRGKGGDGELRILTQEHLYRHRRASRDEGLEERRVQDPSDLGQACATARTLHVGLLPANQIPTRPQRPHVSHFQLANTATHVRSRVLLAAGRTSSTEPGASVRSFAPMFVASIFSHAEKKSAPPA